MRRNFLSFIDFEPSIDKGSLWKYKEITLFSICEEIIFRGFVYKLINSKYTIKHAIIINSILFGIIHFDPSAIIPATILGLSLSIIRYKTKSVISTVIMHSLHNIFALIMTTQAL